MANLLSLMHFIRGTKREARKGADWDEGYHSKVSSPQKRYQNNIAVEFHDSTLENKKKILYVRTAHRNDPDFTMNSISHGGNPLDHVSVARMIDNDMAVGKNYQRLASQGLVDLYDRGNDETTFGRYREEHIGEIRKSLQDLFRDLTLDSLGNPLESGTFRFTKGESHGFMFKNLSGGEKSCI